MTRQLDHLTRPGRIGSLALKNRMVVSAMGVNLAEPDGRCGERILAFHERQARGGVGLIIMGVAGVSWPGGGNQPRQIAISDDRFIPGLRAVADACHRHGARLATQLHHAGLVAAQDMKEGRPLWVPSYPAPGTSDLGDGMLESEINAFYDPEAPAPQLHVMTGEDITTLVSRFAAAATRAVEAGIDGLEIHAGHGYILSEFLSPAMNQRNDRYGGSLENRARLLLEIITAIRARVGRDYPLWVKLDSEEFGKQEGISLTDAVATAKLAEAAGADAINVSAYHDVNKGSLHSESNIPHVPERLVANAAAIRRSVSIPVITAGRIEPASADRHIRNGHFDFLAMGRKLLADPDLPARVTAGQLEAIRPCVYCYCCVSQIYLLQPVKCAVNPETGFERERALIASDRARHIAVIGGGPAGMEAARRLSLRGFRISLLERSSRLGGTLQFASLAYAPNEHLLAWLQRAIRQSDVEVHLNTSVTPQWLRDRGIDEVIVATGAVRHMPDIPGSGQNFVFSGDELRALVLAEKSSALRRKTSAFTRLMVGAGARTGVTGRPALVRRASRLWLPLGRRITIIGAELVGLELAEFLAERGRLVTVIDQAARVGSGLYLVRRLRLLHELRQLGVILITKASSIAIGHREVVYDNYRGQRRSFASDHVVVAQGAAGDKRLAGELRQAGFTTHTVGDCRGISYIEGAMESAAELAVQL
jgi:2,4-dienoyl-CoA reductase-like NADH-dependent reductase (Old Yellow Enzyme family)/thioredoxin reductase